MKHLELKPRILDLYIIKKFISTFFVALILIIGIVIIFDISEKIDDFVSKEAPLKAIIFDYYFNFIPYFMNMFSALFVFITVIFFTSKMAANSEIIAILSCGISFHRMMVPYIVSATIIAAFSLCLNLFIIPNSNKELVQFENKYLKNSSSNTNRNIHYQISPGEFVYVESFSSWNNTAYRFTLEKIENNQLVSKLSAETAVWDTTFDGWKLRKYFIRDYTNSLEDRVRSGAQLDTVINLTVNDFYMKKNTLESLNFRELNELIEKEKLRGSSLVVYYRYERIQRFLHPLTAVILTLIGLALSSHKTRQGIGKNLAIGIALAFTFILFLQMAKVFATSGSMPVWMAAMTPIIIYGLIAAYLIKIAPK